MEEILASIRRIISEDGAPTQEPAAGPGEDTTADEQQARPPAAADQARQEQTAGSEPGVGPLPQAEAGPDDDALLLTEMVTEDGSVVSLAEPATVAAEPIGDPLPEPPLPEPPLPEAPPPEPASAAPVAAAAPPVAPAVETAPAEPTPVQPPPPEPPSIEPDPAEPPGTTAASRAEEADAERDPEAPVELDIGDDAGLEPAVTAGPETDGEPEGEEQRMADSPQRPETGDAPAERLVSDATFSASAAALSQLSRTVRRDKDFPLGGGRMVEDLVREALEPMLREWLDANLAGIVERLVRQEIERMVRRAEEDS